MFTDGLPLRCSDSWVNFIYYGFGIFPLFLVFIIDIFLFSFTTWMEVIKNYMKLLELDERIMVNRNDWKRRIHVLDRI